MDAARPASAGAPLLFLSLAVLLATAQLFWPHVLIKGAFCPALAVSLWLWRGSDRTAGRIGLALLLSAAGDVFLAVDRTGLFVHGLASFLAAHLVYLWHFAACRPRPFGLDLGRQLLVSALLGFVAFMLWVLVPRLGALTLPVCLYILAITLMGVAAIALRGRPLVILGALSFILSDSLIALDKFVAPLEFAGPAIWITYALAQLLITLGWRQDAAPLRPPRP
ncbi:MAG TPA: lysoplasmalogenase [Ferrovibrio sp.]|jgi:uncharacterized membrane protein YhhN|uniref:lysoplasmalogenase n=1 Tax=Ferrovibrio sp. TaxID=1917215 RepID=UPI002B4AD584|nr:lysoplasmalogenase [Ferrovibrio sp.]HLT78140.1 lysoplasmalogenase [Ferrovibrio sp.]